jgi:hypothetical protein
LYKKASCGRLVLTAAWQYLCLLVSNAADENADKGPNKEEEDGGGTPVVKANTLDDPFLLPSMDKQMAKKDTVPTTLILVMILYFFQKRGMNQILYKSV